MRIRLFIFAGLAGILIAGVVGVLTGRFDRSLAPDAVVPGAFVAERRVFEIPEFTTRGGRTIKNLRVGWRSHGRLNADRSNVVLLTHPLGQSSHFAGRDGDGGSGNGWFDWYVGPGKAIDTERFFVISVDTLVNTRPFSPDVVTTGPASIDPDTGRPYGSTFPTVTIRDFVEVQRAVLESLGITRLHAVIGPSLGAMQAYEWAASHPERVPRLLTLIGTGQAHPWLIAWLDVVADAIKSDPHWNGGDYYAGPKPNEGVTRALKIFQLLTGQWPNLEGFGREWAVAGRDPATGADRLFRVEQAMHAEAANAAAVTDANHFLYTLKAMQTFLPGGSEDGLKRVRARTLIVNARGDLIFPPEWSETTAAAIRAGGAEAEIVLYERSFGHGVHPLDAALLADRVRAFIER